MNQLLNQLDQNEFLRRGFSRRSLGRIAALIGAGAAMPFYNEPALAQLSQVKGMPPDAVKINANENPLGPCPEAMEALHKVIKIGGLYSYELGDEFQEVLATQEGLKPNYVQPFAGSSAPLHQIVLGFCSPTKSFVTCDPGYESPERAAKFIGAKVIKVPLTKNYAHDVKKMAAADPNAGIIYICNPNNPTGTVTPNDDITWLVQNKPKGTIILLDEAYTHIAGVPMRSDLVAKDSDLVILRTFSKIYGMAGLRAGAALGRPDLIAKIMPYSAGALPITGLAAATASLRSKTVVPERRKIIGDVREDVFAFLKKNSYPFVPSVSNKVMIDVGKPGEQVIMAMRKEKVYIGRVWPSWPTHVRVSIGTQEQMDKFKVAFKKVMA